MRNINYLFFAKAGNGSLGIVTELNNYKCVPEFNLKERVFTTKLNELRENASGDFYKPSDTFDIITFHTLMLLLWQFQIPRTRSSTV